MNIIEEVDENGNGEIEFDEFCHMMQKLSTNNI
jgi:Ca2+-binding EF-hand superfamily protein